MIQIARCSNCAPRRFSSYVANSAVCGYGRTNKTPAKLSQLSPSGVSFWECNNATEQDNEQLFNDGASSPNENTSGRHGNVAIMGTFDGAARWTFCLFPRNPKLTHVFLALARHLHSLAFCHSRNLRCHHHRPDQRF